MGKSNLVFPHPEATLRDFLFFFRLLPSFLHHIAAAGIEKEAMHVLIYNKLRYDRDSYLTLEQIFLLKEG